MVRVYRSWATAATVSAAVAMALGGVAVSLWADAANGQSLVRPLLSAAVVAAFIVVGAVVASARPENRVGWLMLVGGVAWALGNAGVGAAYRGIVVAPGALPVPSLWAVAGSALRAVGWFVATVGVAILFPDGRLAGPQWRWLSRAFMVATLGSVLGAVTANDANLTGLGAWRNPIALPGWLQFGSGLVSVVSLGVGVVATAGAAAELHRRWCRGDPLERQQLTVFVLAVVFPICAGPLVLAHVAGGWLFSVTALPLPFAIGFAVLARGLYDLRTAANRTLVWITLSAVVAGLYALVITGLGGLLDASGATWLPWAAAAVVAVSFAPLRDALQRGVTRLTFGRWDEPYDVLAALGQRLEAAGDVDRLLAGVRAELDALGLDAVSIRDLEGRVLAGDGGEAEGVAVKELMAYGHPVGALSYTLPAGLRARDERLLDDLAGHLGGVVHAHRLAADLQRTLERVVLAREEERRRLRRDLHDGLGPALAGHLLRLDVIAAQLDRQSAARAGLDALRDELRATVLEVRRVVEGLRPPALDELGLRGAIAQVAQRLTAGSPFSIELRVQDLPHLPAAIEFAAFRIVSEAVTNAVRHSGSLECRIEIEVADQSLRVVIADSGRGLDRDRPSGSGNGLHTMRERAEELGGRLQVESDAGTTIVAELPLPVPAAPANARRIAEVHT
jgi:signal transduction histidine kinase